MNRPASDRSLFWTMAVACFTAALACLAARGVDRATGGDRADAGGYFFLRVVQPDGQEGLTRAATALVSAGLNANARVLSEARAAQLLEQWTGGQPGDLPPLRLIEVNVPRDGPPSRMVQTEMLQVLAGSGVSAEVIAPPEDVEAERFARLRRAAAWLALGLSGVMGLIIALSARAIADRRRDLVVVLADLGAPRESAGLRLSDEAGAGGFLAGLLGAIAAAAAGLAFLSFALPGASLGELVRQAGFADLAPLLAVPFLAAIAAGGGARLAAESLYGRAARLR